MARLPKRLKPWRAFLDWYAQDAGYWYFPKGRAVQSGEIPAAFRVLRKFEGQVWRGAQSEYLNELERRGLFQRRAEKQRPGDATAMARMWKEVFAALGVAWIEDDCKVSITGAGERFLADPASFMEKQMQRYQFSNPAVKTKETAGFEIRPHMFLLEVLLSSGGFITGDEYVLFVSRARTHGELKDVLGFIKEWRGLNETEQRKITSAASEAHKPQGRRTGLVNTVRLNKSYALHFLTAADYLETPSRRAAAAVRLKMRRRRSVENMVRKFRTQEVFIDFRTPKEWFAYYGDSIKLPSRKEKEARISERILEDVLEQNLNVLEEGLTLVGRQYRTSTGPIDLLCKDSNDNFVVVELKKGRAADKAVGQTLRYIGCVRSEMLERRGQKVRGIIVSRSADRGLRMAVAGLGRKSPPIETRIFDASVTVRL